MIVTGSDITLTSSHSKLQTFARSESLSVWQDVESPLRHHHERDSVELSKEARRIDKENDKCDGEREGCEKPSLEPRLQLFRSIIERLTGSKIRIMAEEEARGRRKAAEDEQIKEKDVPAEAGPAGFGVSYELHESYREAETTGFNAAGTVTTADGRRIELSLDLSMERSFAVNTDISLQLGDGVKKDPLVINLSGAPAQLGEDRMSFDIDGDGTVDRIATLAAGSGFISLDANGDGVINDGSELFGTQSGNGFADLARYDLDGNNWIDENDAVFSDLSIWQNPGDNGGKLLSLKESGVGAIYLGNVSTPFDLKDGANNDLGTVKATGIYLAEAGGVGTMQQLDLAV